MGSERLVQEGSGITDFAGSFFELIRKLGNPGFVDLN